MCATLDGGCVRRRSAWEEMSMQRKRPERRPILRLFASVWRDLDAVKARFGDDWESSFLPDGNEALINTCSVRHVDLSGGWHLEPS